MEPSSEKRRTPVAVCTSCGAVAYSLTYVGHRCGKRVGNKRCEGGYGSVINSGDWKECELCKDEGSTQADRCAACRGTGWSYVRKGL